MTGFFAAFCVLMLVSERGSLDDPMFGTGIAGVLNGWASLALYGSPPRRRRRHDRHRLARH